MPIYEYACVECGHELEALQKMSDAPLTECPACQQESLQKIVSAPGFRLSGSGWYETDFKSKNRKNLANKESSGGESGTKESGSKPESAAKDSAKKSDKATKKEAAA